MQALQNTTSPLLKPKYNPQTKLNNRPISSPFKESNQNFPVSCIFNIKALMMFIFIQCMSSVLAASESKDKQSHHTQFEVFLESMDLQAPKLNIEPYITNNFCENNGNTLTVGIGYYHGNPNSPDTLSLEEIKRVHSFMNTASDIFPGRVIALAEGASEGSQPCQNNPDHYICKGLSKRINVIGADNPDVYSTIEPTKNAVLQANQQYMALQTPDSLCNFYTTYLNFFDSSDKEKSLRDKHVTNQLKHITFMTKEPLLVFIFRGAAHFNNQSPLSGIVDRLYITETGLAKNKEDKATKAKLRTKLKKECPSFQG